MFLVGLSAGIRSEGLKLKHRSFPLKIRKHIFYCEGDQALARVAQGGCGLAILGDRSKASWTRGSLGSCLRVVLLERGGFWTRWSPEVPAKLSHSVIKCNLPLKRLVLLLALLFLQEKKKKKKKAAVYDKFIFSAKSVP